ncbi:MAG: hypothetical protein JRC77_04225, partial [Deltaproteobacteria bacterium]|nr:hypothetical protein [Deltaproteobacteria bacterium]
MRDGGLTMRFQGFQKTLLLLVCLAAVGCGNAKIEKMVGGGNVMSGQLECWLDLNFKSIPSGIDPRDVKVRFSGAALAREMEFDWTFIADHDVVKLGTKFGSGYKSNPASTPDSDPPLNTPMRVKFPLIANQVVDQLWPQIWVKAELYWGGKKQDSAKVDVQRLYKSEGGTPGFVAP